MSHLACDIARCDLGVDVTRYTQTIAGRPRSGPPPQTVDLCPGHAKARRAHGYTLTPHRTATVQRARL